MNKKYKINFPGLEMHMKNRMHNSSNLAKILGISPDSASRKLRGEVEFELVEVKQLMREYRTSFENLFDMGVKKQSE